MPQIGAAHSLDTDVTIAAGALNDIGALSIARHYGLTYTSDNAHLWIDGSRTLCAESAYLHSGLLNDSAILFSELLRSGTIEELTKIGCLPPLEPEDVRPYPVSFAFSTPFSMSFGEEWCGEMWKSAALLMLKMMLALANRSLVLIRPQSWYIQFAGSIPFCINPGAIAGLSSELFRDSIVAFTNNFLLPLQLCATGRSHLMQVHLQHGAPVCAQDYSGLLGVATTVNGYLRDESTSSVLTRLVRYVEMIVLPDEDSQWSKYYLVDVPLVSSPLWSFKHEAVDKLLDILEPRTVLDLASNTGWYSRLAALKRAHVIAVDCDEICVNRLYRHRKGCANDRLLPLRFDIVNPSPKRGVGEAGFPPAVERLRSELVMALAISHHLTLGDSRLNFEHIAALLAEFSLRWLIIEFVPLTAEARNPYTAQTRPHYLDSYNVERLVGALNARFASVDLAAAPANGRRLILCEK